MKINLLLVVLVLASLISGCSSYPETEGSPTPAVISSANISGSNFVRTAYKYKSAITDITSSTERSVVLECYVDSKGNGNGLLGFNDKVYNISIVNDELFVYLGNNVIVKINDITGHGVLVASSVGAMNELSSTVFKCLDGVVNSYEDERNGIIVNTKYSPSTTYFDVDTLTQENVMGISEMINYILDIEEGKVGVITSKDETVKNIVNESLYLNSEFGVKIRDKVYSIGDYCNPDGYYLGAVPESVIPRYAYNGDRKIEIVNVSYLDTEGRITFETTSGYVQAITTSIPFVFKGIQHGMTQSEFEQYMGIKLTKKQLEEFVEPLPELVYDSKEKSSYTYTSGELVIEFRFSKAKTLDVLYVCRQLDFLRYKSND